MLDARRSRSCSTSRSTRSFIPPICTWISPSTMRRRGLDGFANWYKIQAQEERDHAMLMVQYLQNNGGKVTLEAIAKPDRELTSRLRVLELGLEHERYVTGLIHTLYEAAYSAKDFRTMQFLDWFVKEQGEEEKNAEDLIKR